MDDYAASTYGDRIAEHYDDWYADLSFGGDLAATVTFLKALAGGGPALELGIGTGRVALPLLEADVEVHGIDASDAMLERLRAKPRGAEIPTTVGDFRAFDLGRRFPLAYVVFNTFFGLQTQDEQVDAFRAVAEHLEPGGAFVMEAFMPDPSRFERGQRVGVVDVDVDEVVLEASMHDPVEQRTRSQRVVMTPAGIRLYPVVIRYAFPSELDLMARLAGLRLLERWGDWDRTPLDASSAKHVSVWQRPG
jgi:SAM-dependent methyltransferase